jgi:hypothetical protein
VKLCPYDKEEPHIWFRLIEAQFAAAGIRSQKLKCTNALASLPKQVLQDILDTIDVCNDSDQPSDQLQDVLLGQFGKSKWQFFFDLLQLPMEMTDLFLAMFLICLTHFIRETVGAGNHKTAADIGKAADASWDTRGGHDPMVAAAMTHRIRRLAPTNGKKNDKRSGDSHSKSCPPSRPDFYSFHNPGNGVCKFHNYYAHNAHRCFSPCAWSEN